MFRGHPASMNDVKQFGTVLTPPPQSSRLSIVVTKYLTTSLLKMVSSFLDDPLDIKFEAFITFSCSKTCDKVPWRLMTLYSVIWSVAMLQAIKFNQIHMIILSQIKIDNINRLISISSDLYKVTSRKMYVRNVITLSGR